MQGFLKAQGSTPLVMHAERLADPLDPYARAVSEIAKKRGKTDADHLELGHREFLGGLYANGNGPYLPAINILRCLQEGAKKFKRGKDVLRGVIPELQEVDLAYDGPRAKDELWANRDRFALRKSVGVQTSRTMRTRPIFSGWSAVLPVTVDPEIFDKDVLSQIWKAAGTYAGLGDMRPIYGRFVGTVEFVDWEFENTPNLGQISYEKACAVIAKEIDGQDTKRRVKHAKV